MEMTTMLTTLASYVAAQPAVFHRICSWCRRDLGALDHHTQEHSYGICETCAHRYFAYLYEPDTANLSGGARELQVGMN
jgi:hypothetical protein